MVMSIDTVEIKDHLWSNFYTVISKIAQMNHTIKYKAANSIGNLLFFNRDTIFLLWSPSYKLVKLDSNYAESKLAYLAPETLIKKIY